MLVSVITHGLECSVSMAHIKTMLVIPRAVSAQQFV